MAKEPKAIERPADIFTEEEFAAVRSDEGWPLSSSRENVALNLGGSVDIHTHATGAFAVVRYVAITKRVCEETAPLLAAARAKAAALPPAPAP